MARHAVAPPGRPTHTSHNQPHTRRLTCQASCPGHVPDPRCPLLARVEGGVQVARHEVAELAAGAPLQITRHERAAEAQQDGGEVEAQGVAAACCDSR